MLNFFNKKPMVCFVTNELFPVDRGGIGRMMHNFAVYNRDAGKTVDIHFLVGGELARDSQKVQHLNAALRGMATIHVVPELTASTAMLPHLLGYVRRASPFSAGGNLATSYEFYLGLLEAETSMGRPFDLIEFPDFGGWGKVSLEAKRAGLAFQQTEVTVRVHSTQSILYRIEQYAHIGGSWLASQFDAEQSALKYADRVIGHIPAVLDYTLDHYGIREHQAENSGCEFPPIVTTQDEMNHAAQPAAMSEEPDFVFSSRLQHFKRPDIFVRAAIAFLDKHPDYGGKFRIISYGWDENYIQMLMDLVPRQHRDRIVFRLDATSDERLAVISRSVVVQPSDYESLCLFAYEASTLGRPVILNGACLAFGAFDRWKDGDNCLLFDGSVPGLVASMEKARTWQPASQVDVAPDVPYWAAAQSATGARETENAQPDTAFTAIFIEAETPRDLQRLRRNLLTLGKTVAENDLRMTACLVLLQHDSTYDPRDLEMLESLGAEIVFSPGTSFDPETLTELVKAQSKDDSILLVPASVQLLEDFILKGVESLSNNKDISMLGGHLDVYDDATGRVAELRTYFGEAPNTALMNARIMSPMLFLRRDVVERIPFDFRAGPMWFEAFSRMAALQGENMIVLPMIAGRMDSGRMLLPENSRVLTSTILDDFGSQSGLSARLLGLELGNIERSDFAREYRLPNEQLAGAVRVSPQALEISWKLIEFHRELGGLLVHPFEEALTVGALPASVENPVRIEAVVRNANTHNLGGEVSLGFGSGSLNADRFSEIVSGGAEAKDVVLGDWIEIAPGEQKHYSMWVPPEVRHRHDATIFFLSRKAEGKSVEQCHIVVSDIVFKLS